MSYKHHIGHIISQVNFSWDWYWYWDSDSDSTWSAPPLILRRTTAAQGGVDFIATGLRLVFTDVIFMCGTVHIREIL